MDEDELLQAIETIKTCARIAGTVPLETAREVLRRHATERTIMPYLDPTHYIQTGPQTEWQQPFLEAFLNYRRELERLTKENGDLNAR